MKYLLINQTTSRLRFRPVSLNDFNRWLEFFKHPSSLEHWKIERLDPVIDCQNWYDRQLGRYENDEGGMNAIMEISSGELVGHGGLLIQQVDGVPEMEIAYSLLPDFRGKGYATELAMKCRDYAFQNDFAKSLISIISLTNTPSVRVALKNGMKVDKRTTYHQNEVNIYRINKIDWTDPQTLNN